MYVDYVFLRFENKNIIICGETQTLDLLAVVEVGALPLSSKVYSLVVYL